MTTFVATQEAVLWLEDVISGFEKGQTQTPVLVDEQGNPHEMPVELVPIFQRLARDFAAGRAVSILSHERLMTTQQAADFIGVSRPTFITLLEKYNIPFSLLGSHRRIDVLAVQSLQVQMKADQRKTLSEIKRINQEAGLYETD